MGDTTAQKEDISLQLLNNNCQHKGRYRKTLSMKKRISTRETQVLNLIAHENTIYEIADKLYISHHTAISHRKNLMVKLAARNTAGLVRKAFELGLLYVSNPAAQAS